MPIAQYIKIPEDDNEARIDIENPPLVTHQINIAVPRTYWRGWFWEKRVINVNQDNATEVITELRQAEKDLDARINNADFVSHYIHHAGALIIAILQITKAAYDKIEEIPETKNSTFNVTLDSICTAIPFITTFLSNVIKDVRDNAIKNKVETLDSQKKLRPS